jgi:O-antigen ligase
MGAFVAHYGALMLGLWLLERDKWRRRLLLCTMLFSIHSLFFSYSRGAYLGVLAAIVFLGLVHRRSLLVLVLALAVTWQTVLPETVVERITMTESPAGELESSAAERVALWEHAVGLFKQNPIFGIGFGAFGLTVPQGSLTDTHNFYLRMLCEQGLIGIALFLIVLMAGFRSGWRLYRVGQSEFHKGIGLGFAASVIAVAVTNVFGDRWSYFALGSYFFIAWGLVDRAIAGVDPEPASVAAKATGLSSDRPDQESV